MENAACARKKDIGLLSELSDLYWQSLCSVATEIKVDAIIADSFRFAAINVDEMKHDMS